MKKPAPIARSHSQHAAAHVARVQAQATAHAALKAQHVTAHAAAVQRKKDAAAARYAAKHPQPALSSVVAPSSADSLATQTYAGGGSGASAAGYGGGYAYTESPDSADSTSGGTTGGDSGAQADKKSGLSTKAKIWLGVGAGGVLVVVFLYRRYVSRPLRRYRQVKGLVANIAEGYKNFKTEVSK